jgi:hypothetical protein
MPLGRAPVTLQLRLDPVDRSPIAVRPLTAVTKLREALDRRLVAFEIKPPDKLRNRIVGRYELTSSQGRPLLVGCKRVSTSLGQERPIEIIRQGDERE